MHGLVVLPSEPGRLEPLLAQRAREVSHVHVLGQHVLDHVAHARALGRVRAERAEAVLLLAREHVLRQF